MPRGTSGKYTLPASNPVKTGTVIASEWANETMSDLGAELQDSLSRSGNGGMLAPLKVLNGTQGSPSYTFTTNTKLGWYLADVDELRFTIDNLDIIRLTPAGIEAWDDADQVWYPLSGGGGSGGGVIASKEEAIEGTENTKTMTPLRVHQAFNFFGIGDIDELPLCDDADDITLVGFYRTDASTLNCSNTGVLHVMRRSTDEDEQIIQIRWVLADENGQDPNGVYPSLSMRRYRLPDGGADFAWDDKWTKVQSELDYADQNEAEVGTKDDRLMSPLRTRQVVDKKVVFHATAAEAQAASQADGGFGLHASPGVSGAATVIETGSNENGWWRKWSDGFIEQWGYKPSAGRGTDTTYDYPIPFTTQESIVIHATMENTGGFGTESYNRARVVSVTQFQLRQSYDHFAGIYWSSKGY